MGRKGRAGNADADKYGTDRRKSLLKELDDFRRSVPYVSASALSAILKEAKKRMPELDTASSFREARELTVNEETPYGVLVVTLAVETTMGQMTELTIVNPFAQLWVATKRCEGFSTMLKERLDAKPSSYEDPWRFIIYSDEVVPGNQLSFHNLRKCWVLYYSFMEFGEATLCNEDAWFCISAERSENVKGMGGGMAQVFREILIYLFGPGGHNLMTSGILLEFPDGSVVRLWARLEMILQDGGAHKQVFMVKGDAGLKQCMECRNFFSEKSNIVDETGDDMFTCNMYLMSEMDFATDTDVVETVHRLADFAATRPGELKIREMACGFNHSKYNMMLSQSLERVIKPCTNMAHDWMHTFVVHGVWNTIVLILMVALNVGTHAVTEMHAYIAMWTLPLRLGSNAAARLADAFCSTRWKSSCKAHYLKCTASDAISMYAIIACYVQAVFLRAGQCVPECQAYIALCDVLDLLVVVARGTVTWQQLNTAIDKFLKACIAAGWRNYMHPKFHWTIHIVRELRKFGMLLTCWVHERKHKMVKRYTNNQRNTRHYERSILSEVTCQHLHDIANVMTFNLDVGLKTPVYKCPDDMSNAVRGELGLCDDVLCTTSKTARVSKFEVVHTNDVVVFRLQDRFQVGQINCLVSAGAMSFAVIDQWSIEERNLSQGTVITRTDRGVFIFVRLACIEAACTYRRRQNSLLAQIIIPCCYRREL